MSRLLPGLLLIPFAFFHYFNDLKFIILMINFGTWFDTFSCFNIKISIIHLWILYNHLINYIIFLLYQKNKNIILNIIFVSFIGDFWQYLSGRTFGYYKIGWISPNKTYEGFIYGYILTIISLYWMDFQLLTIYYILGSIGGLISSLIKRQSGVKDYSNLLLSHGGWLDRSDSFILPITYEYIKMII